MNVRVVVHTSKMAQCGKPSGASKFESNLSMNTEAIRKELSKYIYAHFDSADLDILDELADIFVRSHSSLFNNGVEHTTTGLNLTCEVRNLDTVMTFMQKSDKNRKRAYNLILETVDPAFIATTDPGVRRQRKCQIVFKSFDGFVQACLVMRGPRARIMSRFSAKCTSMVVRLHVALQKDLAKTRAELAEERAQVQRRAFLVIKEAVREWRKENGYKYTDCEWRMKNFSACCTRLAGITYKLGTTPYVKPAYLKNAHVAIKRFYGLSMNNMAEDLPTYTQTKLPF